MKNLNIAIIGNGRVATYLQDIFMEHALPTDVYARSPQGNQYYWEDLKSAVPYRLLILAVSDDAIARVSEQLSPHENSLVVHTSGVHNADVINAQHPRRGVLYPLMSFSEEAPSASAYRVPYCVEARHANDEKLLRSLVQHLGGNYYAVEPEQKPHLHLAAVLSQNFSNHLFHLAQEVLEKQQLSFQLLMPLLKSSLERLEKYKPHEVQTGPAVRGDQKTMAKHLALLQDENTRNLYRAITQSIQKHHE